MRRNGLLAALYASIAILLVVSLTRCLVAVDETEFAMVTQFGRHVATFASPGLRVIWPWQSVLRFDRRLQLYDPQPSEFLTRDPKNILVDVYVCWRIADPLIFLQSVTDIPGAEARLHDAVWADLAAEIGQRSLSALVSENVEDMETPAIMARVLDQNRDRAGASLGIELVDVRLKRVKLPEQNQQSVFDRMRAERDRIARLYRAEGEEEALTIRADADRQKTQILAEARRDAERRRGDAAKETVRIYADAHGRDPEFYRFVRSLEAYTNILSEKATLILSADSELFRYLVDPRPVGDDTRAGGAAP